jgi:hypothetical protein
MSVGKKYYNATLCYLASLHFFLAWVFVRGVGCSGCTPQERGCAAAACVLAYKNHDKKKWRATPQSSPPLGLLAVPRGWACLAFVDADNLYSCWALFLMQKTPISDWSFTFIYRLA